MPGGGSLSLCQLIDEYGEGVYPDLRFYYGHDLAETIAGRGAAPSLVLLMVQRLPDTSMTVALASGGRHQFGWGVDRYLAADTYDAINANTRATGNWAKGKSPTFKPYPRPGSMPEERKKPKTVKELFAVFSRKG